MVSNSEIIKNDIFRYEFVSKFISGKILDHKSNNFTLYHSAKILLQNNVTEVCSLIRLTDNELDVRKLDNQNSVILSKIENKELKAKFDGIISFQNINQDNVFENIEFYHRVLKDSGILIFSVFNKRKNNNTHKEMNEFSIDEIKEKICLKFDINEVYSQRFKEKAVINYKAVFLRKIKKMLAEILKKIEHVRKFYLKNVKKTISKYDPYKQYFHKIPDDDFIPKKYKKNDNSLFLILICKKITS